MRSITQSEVTNLAKVAVSNLTASGTKLEDSLAKIAEEEDLNPQQLRRVVEMANNLATLKLLKEAESSSRPFFDLADANRVIRTRATAPTEKIASNSYNQNLNLDIYLSAAERATLAQSDADFCKEAADAAPNWELSDNVSGWDLFSNIVTSGKETPTSTDKNNPKFKKLVKTAMERLYDEIQISAVTYDDTMSSLVKDLGKQYSSYIKVAKDASIIHGEAFSPVLDDLTSRLGVLYSDTTIKTSATYIVDTPDSILEKVSRLVDLTKSVNELARSRKVLARLL